MLFRLLSRPPSAHIGFAQAALMPVTRASASDAAIVQAPFRHRQSLGRGDVVSSFAVFAFPLCCTVAAVAAGTLATRIPAASMIETCLFIGNLSFFGNPIFWGTQRKTLCHLRSSSRAAGSRNLLTFAGTISRASRPSVAGADADVAARAETARESWSGARFRSDGSSFSHPSRSIGSDESGRARERPGQLTRLKPPLSASFSSRALRCARSPEA